jgi:hypothetical protein
MKQTLFLGILLLIGYQQIAFAQGGTSSNSAQILTEKLKFLEPMLGKNWVGDMKSPDGKKSFKVTLCYQSIWNGEVVKYSTTNVELNYYSEGYFYFDDVTKSVKSFLVSSRGGAMMADVLVEEGKITLKGQTTMMDKTFDYKNTFEFTTDGKMIDSWFQNAFGPWKPGHVVEYTKVN